MRRPMVAGNWKLNGSKTSIEMLLKGILSGIDAVTTAEVVVCPTYVHLPLVCELLRGSSVGVGAQ
ncbi:MAG: triose-phosphate isomerase, partial [Gammaproteobacteria bacterium]